MSGFYVIVSIPLLLVLVGFNHAHGLTTFGKNPNNPNNGQEPRAYPCTNQSNCFLKNTTCLRATCVCGDNKYPVNGACYANHRGPFHICSVNEDCVENADCVPVKDVKDRAVEYLISTPGLTVCLCQEGYPESGNTCGGESNFASLLFLMLTFTLYKIFY